VLRSGVEFKMYDSEMLMEHIEKILMSQIILKRHHRDRFGVRHRPRRPRKRVMYTEYELGFHIRGIGQFLRRVHLLQRIHRKAQGVVTYVDLDTVVTCDFAVFEGFLNETF